MILCSPFQSSARHGRRQAADQLSSHVVRDVARRRLPRERQSRRDRRVEVRARDGPNAEDHNHEHGADGHGTRNASRQHVQANRQDEEIPVLIVLNPCTSEEGGRDV